VLFIPVNRRMTGGLDLFLDICHLKEEGIEMKARVIFDYLKDYIAPLFKEKGIISNLSS
jgi:hypothetical protein